MAEVEHSAFVPCIEAIPHIHDGEGLLTDPFLTCCRAFIPVVEKLGTGIYPVKADMNGNIERLDARFKEDPTQYCHLFNIVKKEIEEGKHEDNAGCTKGLLWLKRAMEFVVHMLHKIEQSEEMSPAEAAAIAYKKVLEPYHGWITYGAFQVALKVVPSREGFFDAIGGDRDVMLKEMAVFESKQGLEPILSEIHAFLDTQGCNFPDKV